ncbi:hypothetical protein ACLESD_09475 [Pyxidicoccus sp. 3LFB2]
MRKLVAMMCLALGVIACGPADGEAVESLGSTEQALCPTGCPWGTTSMGYVWLATGRTSSSCPNGYEQETLMCYDSSSGSVVSGGTTCRTRCALIEAE